MKSRQESVIIKKNKYMLKTLNDRSDRVTLEQNWAALIEADNDLEADIICGFLQEKGIPARKADSSPYTGAMRVIGGLAYEVQVLVPESFLKQAKELLDKYESDFNHKE